MFFLGGVVVSFVRFGIIDKKKYLLVGTFLLWTSEFDLGNPCNDLIFNHGVLR